MSNESVLTDLVAQAAAEGSDLLTLRAVVEEASELGAQRMLAHIGLDDATAEDDLSELRELLQAWRDAKASVWRTAVSWAVRGFLALMLIGIAYRLGLTGLLK